MFYHRGVLEESISTREFQNYISFKRKRWDIPHLLTYLLLFNYLTTTLTASSPSTATATIPAGTAIVALSDVRTVSATTLPKMLEITTDLPAAPWIVTVPLSVVMETPSTASIVSLSVAISSPCSTLKIKASSPPVAVSSNLESSYQTIPSNHSAFSTKQLL